MSDTGSRSRGSRRWSRESIYGSLFDVSPILIYFLFSRRFVSYSSSRRDPEESYDIYYRRWMSSLWMTHGWHTMRLQFWDSYCPVFGLFPDESSKSKVVTLCLLLVHCLVVVMFPRYSWHSFVLASWHIILTYPLIKFDPLLFYFNFYSRFIVRDRSVFNPIFPLRSVFLVIVFPGSVLIEGQKVLYIVRYYRLRLTCSSLTVSTPFLHPVRYNTSQKILCPSITFK